MWLPKLLLIVPDQDFINNLIDEGMGAALVIGSSLHYVIKQIDMLIARRRQDLLDKKPGAVFPEGFPKIVWVRMLKRPKLDAPAAIRTFALRGKFNSILEERLQDGNTDNHFIISIDVPLHTFDLSGGLTITGKTHFWQEIMAGLEKFCLNKISLRPRKFGTGTGTATAMPSTSFMKSIVKVAKSRLLENVNDTPGVQEGRKLPTPPPVHSTRSRSSESCEVQCYSDQQKGRDSEERRKNASHHHRRSRDHTGHYIDHCHRSSPVYHHHDKHDRRH